MTSKVHPLQGAHALLAIAFSLAAMSLSGCGGGSGVEVQGRILPTDGDGPWTVCADANRDFACNDDEVVRAQADVSGHYRLTLPRRSSPDDTLLVAERGEGTQRSWLAAPATAASMGVFSTLVALQWQISPDEGVDAAQRPLRELFGLDEHVDLLDAANWSDDAALQTTARALHGAWQAGNAALARRGADGDGALALAAALMGTTARYLDPERHRLLPGVTARTLGWEVAQTLDPSSCTTASPVVMEIDTDDAAPILTKTDYVKGRLRIEAPGEAAAEALPLSIRGRGNATWALPKKPYRIKLGQASSLLGLPAERDWALLANYLDKTMLRNALAFCMGRQLGMDYTPASRFVELRLNGQYRGVYELTEHIKVGPQRVDIGTSAATADDPGGFLLEIDGRLDEDYWFYGREPLNMPYTVKSDTDAAQTARIAAVIDDFEQRLFGADFTDPATGYAARLDVEALVDYYLINELMRNNDVFFSSTFVHRKDQGKLVFGPLWDFDIAAGNINPEGHESPGGWWAHDLGYMSQLFKDPGFARQVAARWQFLGGRVPALLAFVHDSAAALDAAQTRNYAIWNIGEEPGWPHNRTLAGSYAGEVAYLSDWLEQRAAWLDAQWALPGDTAR
ncbi:MAG TPA: CotH kinase family protein [Rubrivivax sp.]|nr:CotH kinase family protein [Rubrivivax sp.]